MNRPSTVTLARQLYRAGRWSEATRVARVAAREDPEFAAEAAVIFGVSMLRLGRHAEALGALGYAAQADARSPAVHLALAEAALAAGQERACEAALATAAEVGAEASEVEALRGALRRARRVLPTSNAIEAFVRGGTTTPGQWEATILALLRSGRAERAHGLLAHQPPGTRRVQGLLAAARVATQRDDAATAREAYREVVRLDGSHAEEAFVAMLALGDVDDAKGYADAAELTTGTPSCHARLALYRGQLTLARAHAQRLRAEQGRDGLLAALAVVEGRPHDACALLERSARGPADQVLYMEALRRAGRLDDALRQHDALAASTLADVAAAPLARLACRAARGPLMAEDRELLAALRLDFPDLAGVEDALAFAEAALDSLSGNWSESATRLWSGGELRAQRIARPLRARVAGLRQALRALPLPMVLELHDELEAEHGAHPLIDTYRAELALWRGDYARADQGFRRALASDPLTRWAYVGLATCQLATGRPELVFPTLERQRELLAPLPNSLGCLAEALAALQRLDEAEATYRAALEAHPTRTSAWLGLARVALERGASTQVDDSLARVRALVPTFFVQWQLEVEGLPTREQLAHALVMMRGNRSSTFVTWWTADGELHGEDVAPPTAR